MDKVIQVRVITKAGRNKVEKFGDGFKAYLTAAPVGGKANKALTEVLAGYFDIKKSQVKIISGKKSKNKQVTVKVS